MIIFQQQRGKIVSCLVAAEAVFMDRVVLKKSGKKYEMTADFDLSEFLFRGTEFSILAVYAVGDKLYPLPVLGEIRTAPAVSGLETLDFATLEPTPEIRDLLQKIDDLVHEIVAILKNQPAESVTTQSAPTERPILEV